MNKPVLAVDFDDVVNDFNHAFLAYNQSVHGATQTYDDLRTYDYSLDYAISEAEAHTRIQYFCHNLHHTVRPIESVVYGLRLLQEKYDIQMVTGRCESIAPITHLWLEQDAPLLFSETHFTNSFATIHPERRRSKVEVCREIGAVAFVDDALAHVGDVARELGIPVFMPTRPWNKYETPYGVTRIDSFNMVLGYLAAVAE